MMKVFGFLACRLRTITALTADVHSPRGVATEGKPRLALSSGTQQGALDGPGAAQSEDLEAAG
jgi:hypothetical protein